MVYGPNLPPQPPQVPADKTRGSSFYRFISTTTLQKQPNLQYSLIFVCAICNDFHCSIEQLDSHFKTHLIQPGPSTSSISSTTSTSSSSNTTPLLSSASGVNQALSSAPPPTTTTTNKRFGNSDLVNNRIKIIKTQKTITFDTTLSYRIVPINTPRITRADREKLSNHYVFRMQSIDNMIEDTAIRGHHASSLELLKQILSSCRSHTDMEDYQYPSLNAASTTQDEKAFYRMVKHVLMDFVSKCFRATTNFLCIRESSSKYSFQMKLIIRVDNPGTDVNRILKAYQMKNARFETFNKFKAISIQVVKRKLTLSVLSMAPNKKFVFDERRSATIPITFHKRYDWLQVFELLADFEQLLNEQDEIEGILRQENSSGRAADDKTIQQVFETTDYNMNGSQIVLDNISDTNTSLDDAE
ncbi:hypothetical protein INT45_009435 [Circinella minor]|uniref:Uncharacterized protein n=1 Tax=Circinella minor TaxID=1195481 RepID=A0A8H7S5E7_9FUNG|nr:hypothetical protein INT45_009435 [Circinella minor]